MESEKQYTAVITTEKCGIPAGVVSVKFVTKEEANKFIAQQFKLFIQCRYIVMSGYIILPDGGKEYYIDNNIVSESNLYFRARSMFLSGYKIGGKFNNTDDEIHEIMIHLKNCEYFKKRDDYITKFLEIPKK